MKKLIILAGLLVLIGGNDKWAVWRHPKKLAAFIIGGLVGAGLLAGIYIAVIVILFPPI